MKRGRPKGYTPYIEIAYEELADWVGRKTKVPVSKKWLESLMGKNSEDFPLDKTEKPCHADDIEAKIEYTLTKFDDE
tara:strand:+ start:352 stop:582 length:231 start_codon:yes stop_codon:yes gene_type:complete